MPRPAGFPKTGGRTRGIPNRKTWLLEDALSRLGLDVPTQINALLPELPPEKRIDALMELMSFLYPKRKAIEHSGIEATPPPKCELSIEELKERVLELRRLNDLTSDE